MRNWDRGLRATLRWPVVLVATTFAAASLGWGAFRRADDGSGAQTGMSGYSVTLTPISGPMGLGDVVLRTETGSVRAATALVERRAAANENAKPVLRVPLVRRESGSVPALPAWREAGENPQEWWSARVMAGEMRGGGPGADVRFSVEVEQADGQQATLGPFAMSAAPTAETATPDWAKGAVWYQIFPERFRNGNPENDPRGPGIWPTPWTAAWGACTVEELEAARADASGQEMPRRLEANRTGGQFYNVVNRRRYGGDLQGVQQKFGEIRGLGVDAIYLNPIFAAETSHKYDASDYRHVDPTLGDPGAAREFAVPAGETSDAATWTWTAADRCFVDAFLPAAKEHGLRVVLDGVWNHVGTGHWAFRDVLQHGSASEYKDWFRVTIADAKLVPDPARGRLDLQHGQVFGWKSWGGTGRNGGLPEWARTEDGRLHTPVERHIFDVTARWMSPRMNGVEHAGIDGWRLDVAADVPMPFWEAWRAHVKSLNPEAVLIGELWFDGGEYFGGRAFDAQMNYPFARAVAAFISGEAAMDAERLGRSLSAAFSHAPQNDLCQMNLLGSHDTDRIASRVMNPGLEYGHGATKSRGDNYNDGKPTAEAYQRVVLGVALQATCAGAPCVYAGDELGMYGANDPDCRKPVPWPDLGPYENAQERPNQHLREQFAAWLGLRNHPELGPPLRYGSVRHLETGDPDVFALQRGLNDGRAVVVINRSDRTVVVEPLLPTGAVRHGPGAESGKSVQPLSAGIWFIAPRDVGDAPPAGDARRVPAAPD